MGKHKKKKRIAKVRENGRKSSNNLCYVEGVNINNQGRRMKKI